jgi:ankyrin repeat protein
VRLHPGSREGLSPSQSKKLGSTTPQLFPVREPQEKATQVMKNQSLPEGANLRQLKIQAKELQQQLGSKLSEAQFELAKQYGFASWTKLVHHVELPLLIEQMKSAIQSGDETKLDSILSKNRILREAINEPVMFFDSPPIVGASGTKGATRTLSILVKHGADPNLRSSWWAGGFSALDHASPEAAEILLKLGANWDIWSAAKHNQLQILTDLLEANPEQINEKGGDGQTPLHFAGSAETAKLLIEKGADLEAKDIDHESTPIQNHLKNHEMVRTLLDAGATPDIYTAVELDDIELLQKILENNPEAIQSQIGDPPFQTVKSNGGHVYAYVIGNKVTPIQYAASCQKAKSLEYLKSMVSIGNQVLLAAQTGDREEALRLAKHHPDFWNDIGKDHPALAYAAQHGYRQAVEILLELGFNPLAPGMDSGSALHLACWFGYDEVVQLLVGKVPLDLLDSNHGSPPLGWATHGANFCRNPEGDYLACIRILIKAGADPQAPANRYGISMLKQAGNREDVKALLKELGA